MRTRVRYSYSYDAGVGYCTSGDSVSNTGSGESDAGGIWSALLRDDLSDGDIKDIATLIAHDNQEGLVNDALGTFNSAQDADVAAHNFYNPLSQLVDDELQWFVVNIGKNSTGQDQFKTTFASIGSVSEKGSSKGVDINSALSVLRGSFSDSNIVMSGHTHWDSNQKFSGVDTRFNNSIITKLNNRKFITSVSTSNGAIEQ